MSAQLQDIDEDTQQGTSPQSRYKVTIKKDLCIGAASCAAIAPATFGMDDNNIVYIHEGEWDEDDLILAAAQSCPVFAIIIEDLTTGKQIFPLDE